MSSPFTWDCRMQRLKRCNIGWDRGIEQCFSTKLCIPSIPMALLVFSSDSDLYTSSRVRSKLAKWSEVGN